MRATTIKALWEENGFVVIPQLFGAPRVNELRTICDGVLEQWIKESDAPLDAANYTNMAFLTEPRYFANHPERLRQVGARRRTERRAGLVTGIARRRLRGVNVYRV